MTPIALVFIWFATLYFAFQSFVDIAELREGNGNAQFDLIADLAMTICGATALVVHYVPATYFLRSAHVIV